MRPISSLLFMSSIALSATAGTLPSLPELEQRLTDSQAFAVLDTRAQLTRERLEQQRSRMGASFYSNLGYSDNDEVVDVGRSRSYRALSGGVGIRVPLLGSRLQWLESVQREQLNLAQQESVTEMKRRELLRELRVQYANYWAAQRLDAVSVAYLEDEPAIEHALALRTRAGLLLDSDRLEFSSSFAMAKRDRSVAEADRLSALSNMSLLVGTVLEEGVAARPEAAPACSPTSSEFAAWAAAHPEVRFLRESAAGLKALPQDSALYDVKSELRVGYHTSTEWPVEQQGDSAAVMLTVEVPVNFLRQRQLARSAAAAERAHAHLEHDLRRTQIEQEVRALHAQRPVLEQSLRFAALRLAASDESVRERKLRAANLAGDVIEQLQQARIARYNAAKAVLEAELALAHWNAQWSMYAPQTCRPRAMYVWSSAGVIRELSAGTAGPNVVRLREQKIFSVLLSLDREQIERYRRSPVELQAALANARAEGLRVDLLLGEPRWALADNRADLLRIVSDLRGLPFDTLHLDIEPSQLEPLGVPTDQVLAGLHDTLLEVRQRSSWPIELSLHPRDLERDIGGRTLGAALTDLDVAVTLMVYASNPRRVTEISRPLLEKYAQLPIRIAVSTEASLTNEESLHFLGTDERMRRIEQIERELALPNFRGIAVQPSPEELSTAHDARHTAQVRRID